MCVCVYVCMYVCVYVCVHMRVCVLSSPTPHLFTARSPPWARGCCVLAEAGSVRDAAAAAAAAVTVKECNNWMQVQLEWLSLQDAIGRSSASAAAAAAAAAAAGCASMKSMRTLYVLRTITHPQSVNNLLPHSQYVTLCCMYDLTQSSASALLPTLVNVASGKGCNRCCSSLDLQPNPVFILK